MLFKPLDVLGPLRVKGCHMSHFKESNSNDQRATLACLWPQSTAGLKPRSQISPFHHTVNILSTFRTHISGEELTCYTQQPWVGWGDAKRR